MEFTVRTHPGFYVRVIANGFTVALSIRCGFPQAARMETELAEAEATSKDSQEKLKEALRAMETIAAESEAAKMAAREAEVRGLCSDT